MTMIDEDWLSEALQDLGSAIEVPSDGPAAVLAARDVTARAGRNVLGRAAPPEAPRTRRRTVVAAVALASVAALVLGVVFIHPHTTGSTSSTSALTSPSGGFASGSSGSTKSATDSSGLPVASGGPSGPAQGSIESPLQSGAEALKIPAAAPSAVHAAGSTPSVATKVVKTGSVSLQVGVGKLSDTVNQLTSLIGGLGGYVANAQTTEGGVAPSADLTLRVPAEQFETLMTRGRALGKPTSVSTAGQDVTAAYVDLAARIQVLQDTRTQYLQVLAKASAIGDILSVEQQLSDLQTQIEQLQGQQNVLSDQASFGTLTVHVSQAGAPSGAIATPPGGLSRAWAHARSSFVHAVEAVIGASGGILVFLICAGLLLLIGRLAWPVIRRRLV